MIGFGFTVNSPAVQRELDHIGIQVLPRVWEQQLNDTAFMVRDKVREEIIRSVDHPKNYTLKPMKVIKAKWRDGDRMFARVEMLPAQANYLYFPITGQARHPGDPGTGRSDILSFSAKPTAFGGAFNKPQFKRLSKKAKDETSKRSALRAQRFAFQGPGRLPRNLKWVSASRNAPGTFWGVVGGTHGLWQRPERYATTERNSIIGAARGRRGHISTAGSSMKLLLAFQPTVQTPVTIHYDDALRAGYAQTMTEANFVRVLQAKKTWFISRGP